MELSNSMCDLEKETLSPFNANGVFICFVLFFFSLFSLLSKKHNKVLEQATQSLRGSLSSNDVPLPDYVSSYLTVSIKIFLSLLSL